MVTIQYYCPRCGKWQSFLTWKPPLTNQWPCSKCKATFLLDAHGVAAVWGQTIAIWLYVLSVPVCGVLLVLLCLHADKPITGAICGAPCFALGPMVFGYIVGYILGRVIPKI
jgi:hypothetical protein